MLRIFSFIIIIFFSFIAISKADPQNFLEFSFDLPQGWDGGEKVGFSTGDREEYMLILGKKDAEGERYLATINIFLLPNKPGKSAEESAKTLALNQADTSEMVKEGVFWKFTGDPRDNVLKGRATTYVAANKDNLLIIIIKDPANEDADKIFASLKPLSPRSKELLKLGSEPVNH